LDRRDDINSLGKLFCSPSFDFILLPFKTLLLVALLLVDSYSEADPLDRRDDINSLGKLFCSPSFDFILLPFKTFIGDKLILDLAI
jgi:hypothetical protein